MTGEELKGELDKASGVLSRQIDTVGSTLSRKIEGVDKALTNEIESVRTTLIDKIETEIDAVRSNYGVNSAHGGKAVTVEENGYGGEAGKIQAPAAFVPQRDVTVAPQEDEQAVQPGAGEPERPEESAPWRSDESPVYAALLLEEPERVEAQAAALGALELRVKSLEESPARTPPEVEALMGEIYDLGERLRAEGLEGRQALEGRIEKLERRLRKSRTQMLNLWKRLRQKLDGHAKQTLLSLRGLSRSFTERLEQQHEDDGRRLDKLDHSLKGLWDEWQPGQLSLANVQELARATSQTMAEVVGRLVAGHEAKMAAGLPANDRGRAESARALESHRKQLHEIAARVSPLVQTMAGLTEVASSSRKLAPENKSKLSEFLDEIAKFDKLERAAGHQLEALRRNSVRSLYEKFQSERGELEARFRGGAITAEGFARGGLALLETYAPEADPADGRPAGAGGEVLERYAAGAEDRLMDWYSDFFQLYTRLQEARRAGGDVDDDVLQEMARALKVAREVLSRFDIQPEDIVIGQTLYDGRLHDFALTRESSHPTHTIIEVWKSGFHRMRDGETIRRPKVVVSGTGAVSGAA